MLFFFNLHCKIALNDFSGKMLIFLNICSPVQVAFEMIQSHLPCYPVFSHTSLSCRFHVNLQCGSHSGADIALHFNQRYESSGYVVHNTCQSRCWGSEERKYESPFPQGQPFTLQILVEQDKYKVQGHSLSDFCVALIQMSSFFLICRMLNS